MAARMLDSFHTLLPVLRLFQQRSLVPTSRLVGVRCVASSSAGSEGPIATKGPQSVQKSQPQAKEVLSEKPKPSSVVKEEVYQNQEYFNYNEDSYVDLEMEIIKTGQRQTQPNPKIFYKHTDPWKK